MGVFFYINKKSKNKKRKRILLEPKVTPLHCLWCFWSTLWICYAILISPNFNLQVKAIFTKIYSFSSNFNWSFLSVFSPFLVFHLLEQLLLLNRIRLSSVSWVHNKFQISTKTQEKESKRAPNRIEQISEKCKTFTKLEKRHIGTHTCLSNTTFGPTALIGVNPWFCMPTAYK